LAIKAGLHFIANIDLKCAKIAVLTDSQSAVLALSSIDYIHQTIEMEINDIIVNLNQRHITIEIIWIPGHVGVAGNEAADRLAKAATTKETIDIETELSKREIYDKIDRLIDDEWQLQYDKSPTGRQYKQLEPIVSRKLKYTCNQRAKEILITRLRLGKNCLNHYLFKIKRHPTGHCDHCRVPETINHFLLDCPYSNIFHSSAVKTIEEALTTEDNVNKIYDRFKQLNRRL